MARIRVCGECMEPVASCVCPPDPDPEPENDQDEAA